LTIQQETAKILAPCLYVLQKTGKLSKHHLSKILYFADKLHIAKYGRTLSGQVYIAMKNGPVPSQLYDFIKFVQGVAGDAYQTDHVQHAINFIGFESPYYIFAKVAPDMDFLSVSAIKALDASIVAYKNTSYQRRTDDSHDSAWQEAWDRQGQKVMSVIEIAKSAGANSAMIEYIKATM